MRRLIEFKDIRPDLPVTLDYTKKLDGTEEYVVRFHTNVCTTGDRATASKKLGDFIVSSAMEYSGSRFNSRMSDEEIDGKLAEHEATLESYSSKDLLTMLGGHACGCMGPMHGDPYCPCDMTQRSARSILIKRGFTLP